MATTTNWDETMTPKQQRSFKEIAEISEETPNDKIINDLIRDHNFLSRNMSFQSNFDCQVVNIEFAAGEQKKIPHTLGVTPLFRVILRQEGNGVISDIPSGWTTTSIELKNNGADPVRATIQIVRE